ncbi:oligosaccharide flippase family protein [uncultured Pseudokineococcus sp.]|uniref:oligosaccharide flippase family protein n=1 Tax=uncultured Pseudokineococcus sp. TaxID=1642928 RepID=UPI0026257CB2|nr:oligosaccharide flippase family protein [uncultured Pseudokineococcus sp.]
MSTGRAIFRNAAANFALPAAALLTGPLLARALGVEDRGAVAAVLAGLTLATFLAPLGIQEAIVFHLGRRTVDVRRARRVSFEAALVLGTAGAAVLALLAPLILRDAPEHVDLLRMVALTIPPAVLIACWRGMAAAQQRFDLTATERWLLGAGRILLILPLFLAGALTVETAVWAGALLPVLAMLALVPALRAPKGRSDVGVRESRRRLLAYSARSAPGTLLTTLSTRLDQILLASLAGVGPLGLYAVAASLAEIPLQGANAVRDVVFATSSSRDDPTLIARSARLMVVVVLPVAGAGILLAPVVLPLLFGEDFAGAVPLAQVLLVALVPQVLGSLFIVGLLGLGRPGLRSWLQVGSNLVQVVLLLVLIGTGGALGAAVAVLVARILTTSTFAVAFALSSRIRLRDCLVPRPGDVRALVRAVLRRGGASET